LRIGAERDPGSGNGKACDWIFDLSFGGISVRIEHRYL